MFRGIRRKKQALSRQDCIDVLLRCEWGVLGVQGDDGYPYTVPLNYAFQDGRIYFHSARSGHKIDALKRNDKASLCVVDRSELFPAKITTLYRSVVAFGRLHIVEDREERMKALTALVDALSENEPEESKRAEIDRCWLRDNVEILEFEIEHLTGKEAIELVDGAGE